VCRIRLAALRIRDVVADGLRVLERGGADVVRVRRGQVPPESSGRCRDEKGEQQTGDGQQRALVWHYEGTRVSGSAGRWVSIGGPGRCGKRPSVRPRASRPGSARACPPPGT